MNHLWLINQYANTPEMPGHSRHYELAIGLKNLNWQVEIFSSDFNLSQRSFKKLNKFNLNFSEVINGTIWHWLRVFPYRKNNWRRIINLLSFCLNVFIFAYLRFLKSYFKNNQPDIILASSPQLPAAFTLLLLAKLLKKPFILEVRDLWPQVLIDQGGKSPKSYLIRILLFMEKKLYKHSDSIVVLSKGAINYIKKRSASDIFWLPNGPDLNKFRFSELPEEKNYFSHKRPFRILYAGAHGEANDLSNIIKSAKLLLRYPIQFTFIGDGPLKKALIREANNCNNIIFKDPIPKDDIPEMMHKYDAILLSLKDVSVFKYGVSPNKLYDAYAVGRPVISTASGEVNLEIEKNNLGVTSLPNNPEMLSMSIKKLFFLPRIEREIMGINARKLAEEIYSREKIISNYDFLLKSHIK